MVVVFLIVACVLGLIPGLIAYRTGRSFKLWWLYGTVAWLVALIHILVVKPPAEGGTGTFGMVVASLFGGLSALSFLIVFIGLIAADKETAEFLTATGESMQAETQQVESEDSDDYKTRRAERQRAERQRAEAVQAQQVADETARESESPFDPSAIIGRLQKADFCEEVRKLQWQRHDLGNGTERWLGSTPSDELLFEITPDYLYVMGIVNSPLTAANTLLAFAELNVIAFPEDYKEMNQRLLSKMIEKANEENGAKQTRKIKKWLVEMEVFRSLGTISYKVSKPKK